MSTDTGKILGGRAIVIGAGMGGMMAAGVLAKFFTEVMVLDKEKLPAKPEVRNGVPQGAHAHGFLVQGARNVEQIFPGITPDLIDRGAVICRWGLEFRLCDGLGWHPKRDLGMPIVVASRPLLEDTVRAHLVRLGRVTIRDGATVTGWRQGADKITVAVADGAVASLDADLVVDATGRSGQTLEMLQANGYGPVEEVIIGTGISYTSAIFEKPPGWDDSLHGCVISSDEPISAVGIMNPIENDCWIVSLVDRFAQALPKDPADFMAFAKNLADPAIYERIVNAKQVTPIRTYRPHLSKWRRYDRLDQFPERLLPLGDAIAQFNPMFGQGMSVASAHAMCLREVLEECAQSSGALAGAVSTYLQKTCVVTEDTWRGLDPLEFSFPATTGERPADIAEQQAFGLGLRKLMEEDVEVHQLMTRVMHLVEPASVLGREDIVARVNAINAQG